MKQLFIAYSRYNRETNAAIAKLISESTIEELLKKSNSYYASIIDSVLHVMKSDCKWFSRLSQVCTENFLDPVPIEKIQNFDYYTFRSGKITITELIEIRKTMDAQIEKFIEAVHENQFTGQITIPFGPEQSTKELWMLLMQWFNHQTHHRGQISLQFELIGKDNDYSTVIGKIE